MLAKGFLRAFEHSITNPMSAAAAFAAVQQHFTGLLSTTAVANYKVPEGHVIVFRGDSRSPEEVKAAGGFKPRGSNTDLQAFVEGNASSIYVSTSPCELSARSFAPRGYVYAMVVNKDKCIDVAGTLGTSSPAAVDYAPDGIATSASVEAELAVPYGIGWDNIICATPVAMGLTAGRTKFNPDHVPAESKPAPTASHNNPALAMWAAKMAKSGEASAADELRR